MFALKNPALETGPAIELVGPHGLDEMIERTQRWLGRTDEDGGAIPFERIATREVDPSAVGVTTTLAGLALEHRATRHTRAAVAWRVRTPDGFELVYSGDCGVDDPERPLESGHADLAALAQDCDLLVVECSAPDDAPLPGHLSPASAARIARESNATRVLLTHTYPALPPDAALAAVRAHLPDAWAPRLAVARDGLGIDLVRGDATGWPTAAQR